MPIASMPRGSLANVGSTRACCSALSAFCMICAIFKVCAMITETPISPIAQFLDDHGRGQGIRSKAAPFLVERHGADTDLVRRFDDLPGKTLGGILFGIKRRRARLDLGVNETLDGLENHALIFSLDEDIVHGRLLYALVNRVAIKRASTNECLQLKSGQRMWPHRQRTQHGEHRNISARSILIEHTLIN